MDDDDFGFDDDDNFDAPQPAPSRWVKSEE
jgi:hypothetical protein